jgi:alpha-N-arabinofuranosidase
MKIVRMFDQKTFPLLIIPFVFTTSNAASDLLSSQSDTSHSVSISVYPDSIQSDVSHKPIGINLDYFIDDDNYLKPARRTADALKEMGVKYLRYPGGNKSDFYFFSRPPYEKSDPTLARTGIGAVHGRNAALNEDCTDFRNDVLDFDEFMAMCRDYPEGSTWSTRDELITHAAEWVRYANIKKKYGITYWMIEYIVDK